jgi:hypothetical protein
MRKYTKIPKCVINAINKQIDPIVDYKFSIATAYNNYSKKHIRNTQIQGRSKNKCGDEVLFNLLTAYIEIMMDFLFPGPSHPASIYVDPVPLDSIPLSLEEIQQVEFNINEICGTNYTIFQNIDILCNQSLIPKQGIIVPNTPYIKDKLTNIIFNPNNSGEYVDNITITLSHSTASSIYYTIDGKDPSNKSTLYTGPINKSYDSSTNNIYTIKAIAYHDDYSPSDISSRTYTIKEKSADVLTL